VEYPSSLDTPLVIDDSGIDFVIEDHESATKSSNPSRTLNFVPVNSNNGRHMRFTLKEKKNFLYYSVVLLPLLMCN
jgi:hypothetical protein